MYRFKKERISESIYRIDGVGNVCMYFVLGKQRGLLVDTGYGLGDLRGFIEANFLSLMMSSLLMGMWIMPMEWDNGIKYI